MILGFILGCLLTIVFCVGGIFATILYIEKKFKGALPSPSEVKKTLHNQRAEFLKVNRVEAIVQDKPGVSLADVIEN